MKKIIPIIVLFLAVSGFAQEKSKAELIDRFGKASNDDLLARVDDFQSKLFKDHSKGYVILFGDSLTKYRNKRRIEGCNLMRRYPEESLAFIFEKPQEYFNFEFWKVPDGSNLPRFTATVLDYKLDDLTKPVVLSSSMETDEFCRTHFDIEWYSHFLKANPRFSGKVVIDVRSNRLFHNLVHKYRKELQKNGIATSRIRYFRHKFHNGEEGAQFLLLPSRKR